MKLIVGLKLFAKVTQQKEFGNEQFIKKSEIKLNLIIKIPIKDIAANSESEPSSAFAK